MEVSLVQAMKDVYVIMQPTISGIVTALMTALFMRSNTNKSEIEKIKSAKYIEVANDLLANGYITHIEYFKCRNFLKIATIADELFKKNQDKTQSQNIEDKLDFDWFIRFFDASSNISNEDMQLLWAKILAGEVGSPGSFSLRTVETLHRMTQKEALMFSEIANKALQTAEGMWFFIPDGPSSFNLDEIENLIISNQKIRHLQECGLLNPIKDDLIVWFSIYPLKSPISFNGNFILMNTSTVLLFHNSKEEKTPLQTKVKKEKSTFFPYYPLTEAGRQLLPIVIAENVYNPILGLGYAISSKIKSELNRIVTAHSILEIRENTLIFDEMDLLKLEI